MKGWSRLYGLGVHLENSDSEIFRKEERYFCLLLSFRKIYERMSGGKM